MNQQVEKSVGGFSQPIPPTRNFCRISKCISWYTLYRNAQSNVVKAYKDLDSAIIQNFR
ncbi:EscF/YscF/HrpA family type III secretion system needle major subunit [Escherichia coli]|uniref:EscF/YscF/HrpA family type III secretion system needle major subunit n=1 Tax=Escherichia coli TaxID=562 RepID=UPI003EB7FA3E